LFIFKTNPSEKRSFEACAVNLSASFPYQENGRRQKAKAAFYRKNKHLWWISHYINILNHLQ